MVAARSELDGQGKPVFADHSENGGSRFALFGVAVFIGIISGCAPLRLPAIDPSGERLFLPAPNSTTFSENLRSHFVDPVTGQPRCRLLRRFTSDPNVLLPSPLGQPGSTPLPDPGPAFESPPDVPECELPASNQPYTTISMDPNRTSDVRPANPVAPRVLIPGVCQDPASAASGSTGGCWGPARLAGNPRAQVAFVQQQHVAMVGTEVVLIAGVCNGDGYYRMREPLEWALAQGSVGHFVEPGQTVVGRLGLRGRLSELFAEPLPELLSNNYAVSCTSKKTQVLTRGTVATNDDVVVQRGQGWVSVSSPIEGSSYVTVMAPDLDGWEQRKQTAVVHWIDGQVALPPSAVVQGDEPHLLTTTVTRRIGGAPTSGHVVRYQILDATAIFDDGTSVREVVTDANGQASVHIAPAPGQAGGSARVQVDVIRPERGAVQQQLLISQGIVTVTWTAAQLGVQVQGPDSVNWNETVTYRIVATNPSRVGASNVLLRKLVPAGFEYVSSAPAPSATGNRLDWEFATLGPGESRTVEVTYRAAQSGTVRHCASIQADGVTPTEDCLTTTVSVDALYLEMLGPNPDLPVPVGQEILYRVSVTNRGDRPLDDVVLSDRFDDGLAHQGGPSPIEWEIGNLQPGQSRQVGLRFRVDAAGRLCHTLEATASGAPPARTGACVVAEPRQIEPPVDTPRPDPNDPPPVDDSLGQPADPFGDRLIVRKSGPTQLTAGNQGDFFVTIENNSNQSIRNLSIVDQYDPEFALVRAEPLSATITPDGQGYQWYISRLDPGQRSVLQVTCRALVDAQQACSQVVLRSGSGVQRTDRICLPIIPAESVRGEADTPDAPGLRREEPPAGLPGGIGGASPLPGTDPLPRAESPRSRDGVNDDFEEGQLQLTIDSRGQRWQVGDLIEYLVVIRNDRQVADSDVVLTLELPRQVRLEEYTGPVSAADRSTDWRQIRMQQLETLRPGESVEFRVRTRVTDAGQLAARATVVSLRTPEGIARDDISVAEP